MRALCCWLLELRFWASPLTASKRLIDISCASCQRMIGPLTLILAFVASIANASPLDPGQIEVLDGDTIRVAGETFRLVGFDAPETYRARCASERELGNRATFRLRQLVARGGLDLERVACSCRSGTEGTPRCNYGHSCATLTSRGRDVGVVLIAEGLARPFVLYVVVPRVLHGGRGAPFEISNDVRYATPLARPRRVRTIHCG